MINSFQYCAVIKAEVIYSYVYYETDKVKYDDLWRIYVNHIDHIVQVFTEKESFVCIGKVE